MSQTNLDKRQLLDTIFDICEDNDGSVFFDPIIIFDSIQEIYNAIKEYHNL